MNNRNIYFIIVEIGLNKNIWARWNFTYKPKISKSPPVTYGDPRVVDL